MNWKKIFKILFWSYVIFDWMFTPSGCGFIDQMQAQATVEQYVTCASGSYDSCVIATNIPWSSANQVWRFSLAYPGGSIRIYLHNNNTSTGHATQTVQLWTTDNTNTNTSLTNNADQWTQAAINDNSVVGAQCANVAINNPIVPGASGMATCYSYALHARQAAIRITGAVLAAGSPDTLDITITQSPYAPSGPQPGLDGSGGPGSIVITANVANTQADGATNSPNIVKGPSASVTTNQDYIYSFNGTTWDRLHSASLASQPVSLNSTTSQSFGLPMVEKGPRWELTATGATANASIAAAANTRHVIDCISVSLMATAASPATEDIAFMVWDGTTGGTVIWQVDTPIPATVAGNVSIPGFQPFCGLNLTGSTNTAMTCGYSGSTEANLQIRVNCSGYDVK